MTNPLQPTEEVFGIDDIDNIAPLEHEETFAIDDVDNILPESMAVQKDRGVLDTVKYFVGEEAKSLARGIELVPAGLEGVLQVGLQNLKSTAQKQLEQDNAGLEDKTPEQLQRIDFNNKVVEKMDRAIETSKRLQQNWIDATKTGIEAPDPDFIAASPIPFTENFQFTRMFALGMESTPMLGLAAIVTRAFNSPAAGAAMIGVTQAAGEFDNALEKTDIETANKVFVADAIGMSILESVPLTSFMKGGKLPLQMFKVAAQEGGEEVLQQVWQNAVAKLGYDKTKKLTDGIVENFIGGFISGGVIGAFSGEGADVEKPEDKEPGLDELIAEAKSKGVDVDKMIEVGSQQVIDSADVISEAFLEKADPSSLKTEGEGVAAEELPPVMTDESGEVIPLKIEQPSEEMSKLADEAIEDHVSRETSEEEADSVISYVKDGEKIYTTLTPEELEAVKDEVKNIPEGTEGESQIHLDAKTDNLETIGKKVDREEFISGHSQAAEVFDKMPVQVSNLEWDDADATISKKIDDQELTLDEEEVLAEIDVEYQKEAQSVTKKLIKAVKGKIKPGTGEEFDLIPKDLFAKEGGEALDSVATENANDLNYLGYEPTMDGLRQFISDEIGQQGVEASGTVKKDKPINNAKARLRTIKKLVKERNKNVAKTLANVKRILGKKNKLKKSTIDKSIKPDSKQITMGEDKALKIKMQAEQKASKQGYRAGRSEAIAQLKNLFANQTDALKRESELKQLKNDIVARDKADSKLATSEARAQEKLDIQKREAELQRLQDRIVNRDKMRVKKEIIAYVQENLPEKVWGNYLSAVGSAETASDLSSIFRRVDAEVIKVERKRLLGEIKKEAGLAMKSGGVAIEYKQKIKDVIASIEMNKRRPETLRALLNTEKFVEKQRAAGLPVEVPQAIIKSLHTLYKKPNDFITNEELSTILDLIKLWRKLGRAKIKTREAVEKAKKEHDMAAIKSESKPINLSEGKTVVGKEKLTIQEKIDNALKVARNRLTNLDVNISPMDVVFDMLDGYKNYVGANYRIFKKRIDLAYSSYLRMKHQYQDDILKLGNTLKLENSDYEVIGIHAAKEQEGGVEKLLATGLTEAQINSIVLTDKQMKFYEAIRDKLDKLKPFIEETMRVVYNQPLGSVTNYFPFLTDFEAMSEREIKDLYGDSVQLFGQSKKKDVNKGFTIDRVLGKQKIKINAMEIYMLHVDSATYLVNMGAEIKYAAEIAKSEEYLEAVGDVGQRLVVDWVDLLARKGSSGEKRIRGWDVLRKNVGAATLGFKLSSALIQPSALMDGAALIGADAFDGFAGVIISREAREFVQKNFPEVRDRIGDDPAFLDYNGANLLDKAQKASYVPLKFLDALTASGVALGAYKKYLRENNIPFDMSVVNEEAVQDAQRVVRRTQSTALFKDTAAVFNRGDALTGNLSLNKALLQFQSFMLNRWSLIRHDLWNLGIREKDPAKAVNILVFLLLANMAELGLRRLSKALVDTLVDGEFDGEEEDDEEENQLAKEFAINVVSNVPFVSQAVSIMEYGSNPIPTVSAFQKVVERNQSLQMSEEDETVDKNKLRLTISILGLLGTPGATQADQVLRELSKE